MDKLETVLIGQRKQREADKAVRAEKKREGGRRGESSFPLFFRLLYTNYHFSLSAMTKKQQSQNTTETLSHTDAFQDILASGSGTGVTQLRKKRKVGGGGSRGTVLGEADSIQVGSEIDASGEGVGAMGDIAVGSNAVMTPAYMSYLYSKFCSPVNVSAQILTTCFSESLAEIDKLKSKDVKALLEEGEVAGRSKGTVSDKSKLLYTWVREPLLGLFF